MWENLKRWADGELEPFRFDTERGGRRREPQGVKAELSRQTGERLVVLGLVVCVLALFAVLLWVVYTLPLFGTGAATDNELSRRYVEQGMYEVGARNFVANMILIYRGFDTFGEATVLFTAACCVIMLLMGGMGTEGEKQAAQNTEILSTVVRGLLPFLLVFSVYILLNGHLSPGGGFSGGAVLGAGMILLDVALGRSTLSRVFDHRVYNCVKVGALCCYFAAILYLVLCGANGLETGISAGRPGALLSAGLIPPINLLVGFEVACTMYAFFTYFYRGELK